MVTFLQKMSKFQVLGQISRIITENLSFFLENPTSDNFWLVAILIVILTAIRRFCNPVFHFHAFLYILELMTQCPKYRLKTKLWTIPGLFGLLFKFWSTFVQYGQNLTKTWSYLVTFLVLQQSKVSQIFELLSNIFQLSTLALGNCDFVPK